MKDSSGDATPHDASARAPNAAWGGRFATAPADDLLAFSSSLDEDARLIPYDIAGSLAHAQGLRAAGLLTKDEADAIASGLRAVHEDLAAGRATLRPEHEDVHMNVEVLLRAKIGALAGKLHTARSRNDQVALDTRLHARQNLADLAVALLDLANSFLAQATRNADVAVPGFTHGQPAQPVSMGHLFHARAEQALRDARRALDAFDAANVSPLGAGALAGTSFAIDPRLPARLLRMDAAFANSVDAVSDRDYVLDALHAAATTALHLSGFAEELIVQSAPAYGFHKLPEAWTTGSSIMPQKRNPDACELLRGRTAHALAAHAQAAILLKGLPFAYNRDLQEIKGPLIAGLANAIASTRVARALAENLEVDADACARALAHGHPEATEIADHLARKGIPFRDAHHVAGRLVARSESLGVPLAKLEWSEFEAAHPALTRDVLEALDPRRVPSLKTSPGGTAPERVREAVKDATARIETFTARAQAAQTKARAVFELLEGDASESSPPVEAQS